MSRIALERRLAGLEAGSGVSMPAELRDWLGEAPDAPVRLSAARAAFAWPSDWTRWLQERGQ
jgi:hypothetical protein